MQRGPTTFYLRVISQKGNKFRTPSNKIMYKTTDSQHLKLKMGIYASASLKLLAFTTANSNFLQISISGMVEAFMTLSLL